ncbi:hypothetical protein E8E11_004625 [Didymella keratinophila]|nr:hypothetical protein E8E11_004625 [Didymella keratinophila]
MIRPRRKIEFVVVAVFLLCAWFLFDAHFDNIQEKFFDTDVPEEPWQYEPKDAEESEATAEQAASNVDEKQATTSISTAPGHKSSLTQSAVLATPSPSLPDRVVVMAKLPTDDTRWVHIDLQDWQSAIYDIDIETPHDSSTLDPLTNGTLRTLRNKGMEANAYLAYTVQNYNNLPSTIAFIHPHKDGYPVAWHTDNPEHSNVVSLQTLNVDFI